MTDRICIRGCTAPGVHYATCADYGLGDAGTCKGCAPVEARDGVLLCSRCYDRLRRRLEAAPDLVAHLRVQADPLKAFDYTRIVVQTSAPDGSPAPVPADLLDACRDIMHAIQGGQLEPGAASDVAYYQALGAVGYLLDHYDGMANDGEAILEWWRLVMSLELDDAPEFWTITKALSRWPLEDRRRMAAQPCPDCGLRNVRISPARHRHAQTRFECGSCGWRKNETDDDGLWAAAFGLYADDYNNDKTTDQKEAEMAERKMALEPKDIDIATALEAGTKYVLDHPEEVEKAGALGPFAAFLVGAMPAIAEEFADLAMDIAQQVRSTYQNGALIAGGAKMVAIAISASVQSVTALEDLAATQDDGAEAKAA